MTSDEPPEPMIGPARDVLSLPGSGVAYSFCTLVSDRDEYRTMVERFGAAGFTPGDCEFLYVDNSRGNRMEAFAAYTLFLTTARGARIVLCHQDLLPDRDGRAKLDAVLDELDRTDPAWGLAGNAGRTAAGLHVIRISDPTGRDLGHDLSFPIRVMSLDENFIVARRDANLAVSRDLAGFHWYGADLSVVADVLGYSAYVVDFHLVHRSAGNPDASFESLRQAFVRKYARAFRPRWHYTTVSSVFLSPSPVQSLVQRGLGSVQRRVREYFLVRRRRRRTG